MLGGGGGCCLDSPPTYILGDLPLRVKLLNLSHSSELLVKITDCHRYCQVDTIYIPCVFLF